MKKTIAWLTVVLFSALYIYASYGEFQNFIDYKNQTASLIGSDKYKFGDLFGMSYYPLIKEEPNRNKRTLPVKNIKSHRRINLCLAHDSYLRESFLNSKSQINSVDTIYDIEYSWFRKKHNPTVVLDTSKTNVLVFEIVERNLPYLDKKTALSLIKMNNSDTKQTNPTTKKQSKLKQFKEIVFNSKINKNLEFLLFDMRIFTPIKELKSYINYHYFNRLPDQVFISENKKHLFLSEIKTSVEDPITVSETEKTVTLLNEIHDFYKKKGFDEVYFSIIPNPIAIIKPEALHYNNKIPMIQNSPNLKMPMIDIYSDFKKSNVNLYFTSDTHWNKDGFTLWINKLNTTLNSDQTSR